MRTVKGIFLGTFFGFCFSLLVTIMFILGFQMVVGGTGMLVACENDSGLTFKGEGKKWSGEN